MSRLKHLIGLLLLPCLFCAAVFTWNVSAADAGLRVEYMMDISARTAPVPIDPPELSVPYAALYDMQSGLFLYETGNLDQRLSPGFTAKVMTALVAWDALDREGTAVVPAEYARGVTAMSAMNYVAGERVPVMDLFYALLVQGADEAANILAIAACGSIETFVEQMNAKAAGLGAVDTVFANPHGTADNAGHTTLGDAVLMVGAFVQNTQLLDISDTTYHRAAATDQSAVREMYTGNVLLQQGSRYYNAAAIGVRHHLEAGSVGSMATYALAGNMQLICVVFGGATVDGTMTAPAGVNALISWGRDHFRYAVAVRENTPCGNISVVLCRATDSIMLTTGAALTTLLPKDYDASLVTLALEIPESLSAPVTQGDQVGQAEVFYDGLRLGTVPVVAAQDAQRDFALLIEYRLSSFFSSPVVIVLVIFVLLAVVAYIAYAAAYNKRRKKRRKVSPKNMR